jgi:anti-sigma factor (TIGR02949 family)
MNQGNRMDCEEAIRQLAAFLDRELDLETSAEVQRHLDACRSCYSRAEFQRRLADRIRQDLGADRVSPAFQARMRVLLRNLPGRE